MSRSLEQCIAARIGVTLRVLKPDGSEYEGAETVREGLGVYYANIEVAICPAS